MIILSADSLLFLNDGFITIFKNEKNSHTEAKTWEL